MRRRDQTSADRKPTPLRAKIDDRRAFRPGRWESHRSSINSLVPSSSRRRTGALSVGQISSRGSRFGAAAGHRTGMRVWLNAARESLYGTWLPKSLHITNGHRRRVTSTYMDRERRRTTDRAPCRKGFPDRRPLTRIMSLKTQISCHLATQISDVATCPSVEGRFGSGMWSTWHFTPMRKRYPTRLPASAGSA
jgi:hypothetical protein